jgi:stage V sporulation protein B
MLKDGIFSVFYGLQKMFLYGLREFSAILFVVFVFIFFHFRPLDQGSMLPALAWFSSAALLVVVFLPVMLKNFRFAKHKIVEKKKITKKMLSFGIPVLLSTIGAIVIGKLDTIVLTIFRTMEEIGIYNAILPTSLVLYFVSKSFVMVSFPISSELWAKNQKKKLIDGIMNMHKYSMLIILPAGIVLIHYAELFLTLVFGEQFSSGARAFQILLVGIICFMIGQVNNTTLSSIGYPKKVTKIILIATVANVILNFMLIPRYGIVGAAIATFSSYAIVSILSIREIQKTIGFKAPWANWLKIIIGGMLYLGVLIALAEVLSINIWIDVIIALIIGFIVYCLWIFITKVITIKEIQKIMDRLL